MERISVLLVEDEPTLAMIIKDALEAENFTVNIASDGVSGLEMFLRSDPDIIVSDVMMPKMSGLEMVQKIRQTGALIPVLFLTARTSADDVVEGFEAGGNDYLKKPFGMKELVVRMMALLGRIGVQGKAIPAEYTVGKYMFTPARRLLTYLPDGESEELPNRESEILKRLCANGTRSFQVLISRLRHRLSKDPGISIMNIRGEGYRLIC